MADPLCCSLKCSFYQCFPELWTDRKTAFSVEGLQCQSVCPFVGIGSTLPLAPQASVAPRRTKVVGESHSLAGGAGEGGCVRGTNSDEGTDTLVLYVYYCILLLRLYVNSARRRIVPCKIVCRKVCLLYVDE